MQGHAAYNHLLMIFSDITAMLAMWILIIYKQVLVYIQYFTEDLDKHTMCGHGVMQIASHHNSELISGYTSEANLPLKQ